MNMSENHWKKATGDYEENNFYYEQKIVVDEHVCIYEFMKCQLVEPINVCLNYFICAVVQTVSLLKPEIGRWKVNTLVQLICISRSRQTLQMTQMPWPMLGKRYKDTNTLVIQRIYVTRYNVFFTWVQIMKSCTMMFNCLGCRTGNEVCSQ